MEKIIGKLPVNKDSIDVETILSFEPYCKMVTKDIATLNEETKQKFLDYYYSLISEQFVTLQLRISFDENDEVNIGVINMDFTSKEDMQGQLLKAKDNDAIIGVKRKENDNYSIDDEYAEDVEPENDYFSEIKDQITNLRDTYK